MAAKRSPRLLSQLHALAIIALVVGALLAALEARGAERRVTVAPGLIELRLDQTDGADVCQWQPLSPLAVPYRTYESGGVLVTYATSGELVFLSYLVDFDAKRFESTTWVVTVGDAPAPTPRPDRPEGFAGEVFDRAYAVGQPAVAAKYAAAIESVLPQIGTTLTDLTAVHATVKKATTGIAVGDARWQAFGAWLREQLNTRVLDVPSAAQVFSDVAKGLKTAGGAR
jgi:hypothetical protein